MAKSQEQVDEQVRRCLGKRGAVYMFISDDNRQMIQRDRPAAVLIDPQGKRFTCCGAIGPL